MKSVEITQSKTIEHIQITNEYSMSSADDYLNNSINNNNKSIRQTTVLETSTYNCSNASSDNDLSFSLAIDSEIAAITGSLDSDELPAFEIRLLSPTGTSTPSPINCDKENKRRHSDYSSLPSSPCENHPDFVALSEINAQISPPSEYGTPTNASLETIFEGVFLSTPPRPLSRLQQQQLHTPHNGSRCSPRNLFEKIVVNRCLQLSSKDNRPLTQISAANSSNSIADERIKECNDAKTFT